MTVVRAYAGNNCIRKWDQMVTTVAGDCASGEWGLRDGNGADARFSGPTQLALLPGKTETDAVVLYVTDTANNAVRVIRVPAGGGLADVSTLVPSLGGDLGLRMPTGIAIGFSNTIPWTYAADDSRVSTLFVSDYGARLQRLVTPPGSEPRPPPTPCLLIIFFLSCDNLLGRKLLALSNNLHLRRCRGRDHQTVSRTGRRPCSRACGNCRQWKSRLCRRVWHECQLPRREGPCSRWAWRSLRQRFLFWADSEACAANQPQCGLSSEHRPRQSGGC